MSTDNNMSEGYQAQEQKNVEADLVQQGQEAEERTKIYWSPASEYQIANFVPEKKGLVGNIIQAEAPLKFSNHIVSTDDQKKIDYIEASDAFKAGIIRKCKTREEALGHTAAQDAMKTVKEINCEDITVAPRG